MRMTLAVTFPVNNHAVHIASNSYLAVLAFPDKVGFSSASTHVIGFLHTLVSSPSSHYHGLQGNPQIDSLQHSLHESLGRKYTEP